jgi:hypothetical protein
MIIQNLELNNSLILMFQMNKISKMKTLEVSLTNSINKNTLKNLKTPMITIKNLQI